MKPDVGIDNEKREELAKGLGTFLADTFALYLKTLNFHWNVTGRQFRDLHLLFEEHYNELAGAVDVIAERITMLGFPAPGSFKQFMELTSVDDAVGVPPADDMVKELLRANENIIKSARKLASTAAEAHDEATVDLLTQRMAAHEKAAWMLRSTLE